MATLRASLLARRVAAATCPRAWMQLEQQFSLLRVSPAHTITKPTSSHILAQARYRTDSIHIKGPEETGQIPEMRAEDNLAIDAILDQYTGGSLAELPPQPPADLDGAGGENALGRAEPRGQLLSGFARAVPASPSYFTRTERFTDSYLTIRKMFQRYSKLPTIPTENYIPVEWVTIDKFKKGEDAEVVIKSQFDEALAMAKVLHRIHPDLRPSQVDEAIEPFIGSKDSRTRTRRPLHVDKHGRSIGRGRRKESVARAWVVEGTGEMLVNGKTLSNAFGRVHDRVSATWALRATDRMDKYNVWALVEGGGTTGQAEAVAMAVAYGLLAHEPALKTSLRKGEFVQTSFCLALV